MRIQRLIVFLSLIAGAPVIAEEAPGAVDPKEVMREAAIEKADVVPPPLASPSEVPLPVRATPAEVGQRESGALQVKDAVDKRHLGVMKHFLQREVHRVAVDEAVRAAVDAPALRGGAAIAAATGRANGKANNGAGWAGESGAAEANRARAVRDTGSAGGKPPWAGTGANPGNGNAGVNPGGNGNGKGGRP